MTEKKVWPTGVIGLDSLLRGGFVLPESGLGLVVLIRGQPGTGKTTLAIQIAGGARHWDMDDASDVEVHSCEQSRADIKAMCARLNLNVRAHGPEEQGDGGDTAIALPELGPRAADLESPLDETDSPPKWARRVATALADAHEQKRRLVVVDGLNLLSGEQRRSLELEELVRSLRLNCRIGILVYEPSTPMSGGIHSLADMVIELRGDEVPGPPRYYLNRLLIVKSRFQQSVLGWHQYKIRTDTGVNVFPSIHYRVHRIDRLKLQFSRSLVPLADTEIKEPRREGHPDDGAVLTSLLGPEHLRRGSCTVVLGPRRTWKTQLTLDFLRAGSRQEEHGLLVSFLDNQGTIVEQRPCLCDRYCLRCQDRKGDWQTSESVPCDQDREACYRNKQYTDCFWYLYLFHFRPGCLAPGEFFHMLEERLRFAEEENEFPIRRLVFWDLTQLESRFPLLARSQMFLPGLMDYLKHSEDRNGNKRRITSVFMGAPNTDLAKAAQAMADNVVFCWRDHHAEGGPGVAFYIDRIEGLPGRKGLFFLKELDKQVTDISEILTACDESSLPYAESMIEEIRNLQGLPARKRPPDD
ncbi:MAG: ATPase domain-containing protein [Planctomycetota bacterium]|jgi:KaiC/GvpD/RAD55 family RecA-like ATPase